MKTMKKALCMVVATVLFVLNTLPISALAANMPNADLESLTLSTSEMKEFLAGRGYPAEYLDTLIPQQLEVLYQTAYENNAYFLSTSKNPMITPYGNISTSQLDFQATYSYVPFEWNGITYMYEIFVTIDYDWTKLPVVQGVDAISANWDSSILTYNENFKSYDYAYSDVQNKWITYKTWDAPNALNQGGLGISTYINYEDVLYNGETVPPSGIKGTVTFSLTPEPRFSMGNSPGSNSTTINCEYVHNKSTLYNSLSFSYQGVGVTINTNSSCDSIADSARIDYTKYN